MSKVRIFALICVCVLGAAFLSACCCDAPDPCNQCNTCDPCGGGAVAPAAAPAASCGGGKSCG
jgi:hypothetical protein